MDDKDVKGPLQATVSRSSVELANATAVGEKQGTRGDENDMDRMGKVQVLQRQFKFMSIFGYAVVLGNTWEFALMGLGLSLHNGGAAGGIWMFLVASFGYLFISLSFAEMVSMAPSCGGQYHWVSELAPRKHQKFLSYVVGWLSTMGWQVGMASTANGCAQHLQALIMLNVPSYVPQGWHGTLFTIAVTSFAIVWNTVLVKKLPLVEGIALSLHFLGFFAIIVVLWVMGPRSNVHDTWTKFEDPGGWGHNNVAVLVGIIGPTMSLSAADMAVHLAEEVADSARTLPRAMISTVIANISIGFVMLVTVFSTMGSDPDAVLNTTFGQPWIQIVYNATESIAATSIMTAIVALLLLFCAINNVTCSSRQLFSFARDNGLPFSAWLARVPQSYDVPVNAVMFTFFTTCLCSLLLIGSNIAFNILMSFTMAGIYSSYILVIACMIRKRLLGERLVPSPFSLGRAGLAVNVIALCWIVLAIVFMLFPPVPNPSLVDMNWASVMLLVGLAFSMGYYHVYGKHHYEGPVVLVKQL
ncbi:GABA-specific permease [Ophiobolus disseminans]|uniref:GABA-specific permease n=1 Tax=Ophiobolus disseminans TaxID=1469910 RepID=A0A6A7A543_9PLEO|nr:GABA-specific permease [Ophiobolus disseminans]